MEFSLGGIFRSLDLNYQNGLADENNRNSSVFQRYFFAQAKEKLGIDAVYFLRDAEGTPKIPLIYFSKMDSFNAEKIAELHRLAWNSGEAPLLFVVVPDQILVYNNYEAPVRDANGKYDYTAALFTKIENVSNQEEQRKQLLQFHRLQIETGRFWEINRARFSTDRRIDVTLMENLKVIRKTLIQNIMHRDVEHVISNHQCSEIVHSVLGRSIFIKYLEERKDSNRQSVFPAGFFSRFLEGAREYTDLLIDKKATYKLYEVLAEKFNGDLFPVADCEEDIITQEDLIELQQFLLGKSELATNQTVLWTLYSFNNIPIQLISSIYELFFHLAETDPKKEDGTYYTPYHLVEMLMDEVLPWEGVYSSQKILDPSCGSGIFLVEAYRRLIGRWLFTTKPEKVQPNDLVQIMTSCIYGVDMNKEAIRVASFSLSLAMCDYLEPRTIWNDMQFPRLLHYNLFHNDFFDSDNDFTTKKYDIIIGNPPWESQLSPAAKNYIKLTKHPISDNQIAQAFTWRAGELCPCGVVCLLLPSKSFLFNRSEQARKYRQDFFLQYHVSVIINFSAFRWVLFEHAVSPAVAVIYQNSERKEELQSDPIFYCTPKPLYTIEDRRSFLLEPTNICRIPRQLTKDDRIWKIAMWGSPRDLDLVQSLQAKCISIRQLFDQYNIIYAEGYKLGNKNKKCQDFLGMPTLNARSFSPQTSNIQFLPLMNETKMECTVSTKRAIFSAPHLIIKQSHKGTRFYADVLDFDVVFNHSFLGAHGDERILKYCCLIIWSKVFTYYQMMTNRKWLVERDELEAGDILDAPIPSPTEDALNEAVALFDSVSYKNELCRIDDFASKEYRLFRHETSLIDDALTYLYDFYTRKAKSTSLLSPTNELLRSYYTNLQQILRNTLGNAFSAACVIYHSSSPLIVAELDFSSCTQRYLTFLDQTDSLNQLLKKLDKQLLEERSGSVYVKRNVRIYNKDKICIVKPNQARYWNFSSACRDADEIYSDIMRAWRNSNE